MGLKKINKSDILKIYKREQSYLLESVKKAKNPYHIFSLSTINNHHPESRIVVLRNVQINPLKLYFNSDIRSPKFAQLKKDRVCSALFYDQIRKVQLRFKCEVKIHYDNDISKIAWNKTALQSRKCYMAPFNPSSRIESWHPNIPIDCIDRDPTLDESNLG